jgi:hypothetical protein
MAGSSFYTKTGGPDYIPGIYKDKVQISTNALPIPGIQMPQTFSLGDTYLLAEYVYLDKPEANRFRLGDIQIPMTQHYRIEPRDTQRFKDVTIPLELPNPTRHLFFMAQNYNAVAYNTYFLATRDLASQYRYKKPYSKEAINEMFAPWWPDCSGLNAATAGFLAPGFSTRGSEPFTSIELLYEGSFVKTSTENCAMYRSILPSLEERKSPWINRYMYCIPFGVQQGYFGPSMPMGEVNMGRIMKKDLRFGIAGSERLWIHVWAETFNILRIFGGRAGLLFGY